MKVKRLWAWAEHDMQPGYMYDEIPYNWERTDDVILRQFDTWRRIAPDAKVVSITGPLKVHVPSDGDAEDGWGMEMTILYD